ncbi:MAG: CD0415/CD1112 family protein, partial [Clostridia bacterium]
MDFIWNKITEWLKGIMIGGIMGNLQGLFDNVNTQVGGIAGQVGSTPQAWNSSVYGMIRSLSDNVILPIAGVILAIVMTMELLQLVLEKNNMQNFETWVFFKWMFKTFCAVMIVTNTWNIIMGVFDAAQSVVNSAAGIIGADTAIDLTQVIGDLEARLQEMEIGPLLGLWFQTLFVGVTIHALSICIFVIVYGRMMEIYIVTSLAPIPMATMMNHDWGQMGQSYLKSLFAL